MVDNLEAARLLRQAASDVRKAAGLLDMRSRRCGDCGAKKFANKRHAEVSLAIEGTPGKLTLAAQKLEQQP